MRVTCVVATPWLLRLGGPPWRIEDFFDHPDWWRVARRARLSPPRHLGSDFGWFVIEEKAGAEFLNALSNAIRDREVGLPATMRLATVEPAGFALSAGDRIARADADEPYQYALFRDGLALLGEPFRGRPRNWDLGQTGFCTRFIRMQRARLSGIVR